MCNESLIPDKGGPPIEYPYMAHVLLMINHTLILSHRRILDFVTCSITRPRQPNRIMLVLYSTGPLWYCAY